MSARLCVVVLATVSVVAEVVARVDPLFRARCHAACIGDANKMMCESQCGLFRKDKPGSCPGSGNLTWYEGACIKACILDVECPGTDKCCKHSCGTTCQHAVDLELETGLPAVPTNLTVSDSSRQRAKLVQWSPPGVAEGEIVYVLQQRSHVGVEPDHKLFGPWKPRSRRRRNKQLLTALIPAHWYQVRVAAVNANGSRGYSQPSKPFTLKIGPRKPDEPHNLTVLRPGWVRGRMYAELRWRRAPSDLPIHHYRIFWSHYVEPKKEPFKEESYKKEPYKKEDKPIRSVIVNQRTVSYRITNFVLRDLEPQSLYFIQIQAITIPYGRKKLSSEKAVVFFDTSHYINATYKWMGETEKPVRGLRVLNFFRSSVDNLEARLMWNADSGHFLVKWSPHPSCTKITNNPTYEATTEGFQYDIYHLEFNCKYQVKVSAIGTPKSAAITITTPHCQEVNSKLPCH